MLIRVIFFTVVFNYVVRCQYDLSNVVPGAKMSVNDDMFVSASNSFSNFAVVMRPFADNSSAAGGPVRCNMRYNTTDRFVHSVAVVGVVKNSTDANQFIFVFAAERISSMTPYVCIGFITKSTCISQAVCTDVAPSNSHQQYFLIGVDTNKTFAYGFTSSFAFKLDIYANKIVLNLTANDVWPSAGFIPHAMDVADTWAVVAGYGYLDTVKQNYATWGCLIDLSVLKNASCISITSETTFLVPSNVVSYNELYELSVAIRHRKVLVGVQRLSSIVTLQNLGTTLNVTRINTLSYSDAISVGRVVAWAHDTSMAVLMLNPGETTWSQSQIFFYDVASVTLTTPLFTFPNNQQILGSRLLNPTFARFGITPTGNMAILTGDANYLIVPISAAGYTANWIDTNERVFVFYYLPKPCIGGTYKNRSSLGPCQICPPNTRNPGILSDPILQCIPCSNANISLCPLASLADIDSSTVLPYSQAVAYPETADTTDIEDLLVKNMFQISSEHRCLLISPLLWTLVVSGICFLILLFMMVMKLCGCKQYSGCRKKAQIFFKHTDIIGEGEMWAGGLATLCIIVLVSFSYWFSVSFIQRYPIEDISGPAKFACDESLSNAQFSSGLELLAIPKTSNAQPIFDLLDRQTFNLTVELINTGFNCNTITTQENLSASKYVLVPSNCTPLTSNAITSITFPLPKHLTTVQINMTGPNWIGAFRLCIRGTGQVESSYTLRDLDFCKFYSTPNEAIGRLVTVPIVLIKNINMTQALTSSDPTLYSGLWIPTFTDVPLSDEAYYDEFGNYLRYMSSLTVLQVEFDEYPFFIKNIQQPIVRTAELIFHGLLFTSLCIELFAFGFLLTKLIIVPVIRSITYLGKMIFHRIKKSADSDTSSETNPSNWKVNVTQTTPIESDSSISNQGQNDDQQRRCSTSEIELNSMEMVSRL